MQMTWMRLALSAALAGTALAGCAQKDPAKHSGSDARDVAMVERMRRVPLQPIVPEPITTGQIVRDGLDRAPCSFRKKEEADPLFLAGAEEGFLSVSGEIARLAARTASAELPGHARAAYVGLSNWVEFSALPENGEAPGAGAWPARMIIHDQQERIAFSADGIMSCRD